MTVATTDIEPRPAVGRSAFVASLAVLAAVSFAIGDSWVVDNIELSITRDLCGGSCTGVESNVSATGPGAVAIMAFGLLVILNATRARLTAARWRTIIATSGVVLATVALSAFAVLLVRIGLFGVRFPAIAETCLVNPTVGDCIRPDPASWAWPAGGTVFATAAATAVIRR